MAHQEHIEINVSFTTKEAEAYVQYCTDLSEMGIDKREDPEAINSLSKVSAAILNNAKQGFMKNGR